jgi:hypothetical protein
MWVPSFMIVRLYLIVVINKCDVQVIDRDF